MSNYSILTKNTLDGLSEMGSILYLKLLDSYQGHGSATNERKAFYTACLFDERSGNVLDYILRNNFVHDLPDKTVSELSEFFAARWRNNFMGRRRHPKLLKRNENMDKTPLEISGLEALS